ncbi:MAG: NAD-dependent epimerase [Deltaproteobacteria bacterium RBG_13_43_22]|nr:MAG: NAD-dependent epimerase [Deltaproteobacteria bacterium RBG_13_43_22]
MLITGSAGLIGSEAVRFFGKKGFHVVGIDNNMRQYFFGYEASTSGEKGLLEKEFPDNYIHYNTDIRNYEHIKKIFNKYNFDLIIHTAAQPSHDWAAREPITDFTINANGTLILLENYRKYCPNAVFIFTSTNKVYGDTPNLLPLIELEKRYEIDPTHKFAARGIDESMSIDNSKHSLFGASKVAADLVVQEYGKYYGLKTGVFRGGCLTGPAHAGAELHGFLSYLAKCIIIGKEYTIFGYKGKQVRDNIHSYDLISAFEKFYHNPKCGEVYNIGGSRHSNISILEAVDKIEEITGEKAVIRYESKNREGDHIWYISDVTKFKSHYPDWEYRYNSDMILKEICVALTLKNKKA